MPHEPMRPVETHWDLGVDDATAIWFTPSGRMDIRIIDYYENRDQGLPFYIQFVNQKAKELGYVYGKHWGPHDIQVRDFGTGKSRIQAARELGLTLSVVPNLSFADGINAVRLILPKCYFDETKCAVGLDALRQYRRQFNARMNESTGAPVHDEFSHAADALRRFAVTHKPDTPEPPDEAWMMGFTTIPDPLAWMGG